MNEQSLPLSQHHTILVHDLGVHVVFPRLLDIPHLCSNQDHRGRQHGPEILDPQIRREIIGRQALRLATHGDEQTHDLVQHRRRDPPMAHAAVAVQPAPECEQRPHLVFRVPRRRRRPPVERAPPFYRGGVVQRQCQQVVLARVALWVPRDGRFDGERRVFERRPAPWDLAEELFFGLDAAAVASRRWVCHVGLRNVFVWTVDC